MVRPHQLGFIYTLDCPLQCDFCCHPVEVFGRGKLSKQRAMDLIHDAKRLGTFCRVAFTGGESFLYREEILDILKSVDDVGMAFRIVTSGYWASTEEKARAALEPLATHGLDELYISTDPSHQKYVPVSSVQNAVRVGLSLGLRIGIAAAFWKPDQDIREVLRLPEDERISYSQRRVVPAGRAADHGTEGRECGATQHPEDMGACRGTLEGMNVTVYPDGSVYPCCATFNLAAQTHFGNVHEDELKTLTRRMEADRFTRLMFTGGPQWIWGIARLRFPQVYGCLPKDEYCSVCQVCVKIRDDEGLMKMLDPVVSAGLRLLEGVDLYRKQSQGETDGSRETRLDA